MPYVVRFKMPQAGAVTYVDKVFGEVTTPNARPAGLRPRPRRRRPALQLRRGRRRRHDGDHARRPRARPHGQHAAADPPLRGVRREGPRVRPPADDARAERREALEAPRRRERDGVPRPGVRAARRSSTTSPASAGRTATRRSSRSTSSSQTFDWEHVRQGGREVRPEEVPRDRARAPEERRASSPDDEYAARVLPFLAARGIERLDPTKLARRPRHGPRARAHVRRGGRRARLLLPRRAGRGREGGGEVPRPGGGDAPRAGSLGALEEAPSGGEATLEERIKAWLARRGCRSRTSRSRRASRSRAERRARALQQVLGRARQGRLARAAGARRRPRRGA